MKRDMKRDMKRGQRLPQPAGPFTESLWEENRSLVERIASSSFYRAMGAGTLSRDDFRTYLEQDALYLKEDNRALSLCARRAGEEGYPEEERFFALLANEGMALELDLHRKLDREFAFGNRNNQDDQLSGRGEMNPACTAYAEHLIRTAAEGSYEEAAAALLPCYWVYQSAGLMALERAEDQAVDENPYREWMATYAGEEFHDYTAGFIRLIESVARRSCRKRMEKMREAFGKSTELELRFIQSFGT